MEDWNQNYCSVLITYNEVEYNGGGPTSNTSFLYHSMGKNVGFCLSTFDIPHVELYIDGESLMWTSTLYYLLKIYYFKIYVFRLFWKKKKHWLILTSGHPSG